MHRGPSTAVAFDERGYLYSAGYDSRVVAWSPDLTCARWTQDHDGLVNALAIGSEFVYSAGADRVVRRWHRETGEPCPQPVGACPEDINALALSADQRLVATASDDGILRVFAVEDGELLWALSCGLHIRYGESIESLVAVDVAGERLLVAVDNSGNILVADFDGEARAAGSVSRLTPGEAADVDTCAADAATERLYCGLGNGDLLTLPLSLDARGRRVPLHRTAIKAIAVDQGRVAVAAYDGELSLSDVEDVGGGSSLSLRSPSNQGWARGLAFSPTSPDLLACTSLNAKPQIWNVETGTLEDGASRPTHGINALAIFRGRVFAGSDDGSVWVVDDVRDARCFAALDSMVLDLAAHPSRFLLAAVTHSGAVYLLDGGTGHVIAQVGGDGVPAPATTFTDGGSLLAVGTYSGVVRFHAVPSLRPVGQVVASDTVKSLTSVEHSRELVVGVANGSIGIWNVRAGTQRAHRSQLFLINDVDWHPQRRTIVSVGRDQLVRSWTLDLELEDVRPAHERSIKCVGSSPDGRRLATGGYDGMIEVFGDEVCRHFDGHDLPGVTALSWLDSDRIVSAGWDGTVRWWSIRRGQEAVVSLAES